MKREHRTILMLIFAVAFLCWPIGFGAGYATVKRLSDAQVQMLLGWAIALGTMALVSAMLSGFVLAYSILRRKEEDEDDQRELALLRTVMGQREQISYNIQQPAVRTNPPVQIAAHAAHVMDYKEIDLE